MTGRIVAIKFKTAQIQVLSEVFAALSCRTGVNFFAFFKRGEASAKRAWAWSATVEGIRVSRSRPALCSPGKRAKIAPVLQAIAPVIVLVTPRRKKERSWEQEKKVEPSKNLNCDQAFLFSRNGIARKSANEERRKRGRRPFLLASKAKKKTEEGPPDRSLPKTEKSH